MKKKYVWITFIVIVTVAIVIAIVVGDGYLSVSSEYELARNSLNRLVASEEAAAFVEQKIAALKMPYDRSNVLFHSGQRIVGPVEDPDYYMPSSGLFPEFLNNPRMQKKTRDLLATNSDVIRDLQKFFEQKSGVQTILAPEELRKFNRSIGKIINLCCDRMAQAVLERNQLQARRILEESCYFLTVASLPLYLRELSDFNIALTVWQVHIFGNYVNYFKPASREIDELTTMLQALQDRLSDAFRSALAGECLALYRQFSTGNPRISWRIDRYDDYFHRLNHLPRDCWIQADRIFQLAETISSHYSDFRNYYLFADSLQRMEQETDDAAPLVKNYCRLFWTLCRSEAVIYAQLQCDLVKLAVLKFWNSKKHFPKNLGELTALNQEKELWIDPLTGRSFFLEIKPGEKSVQVLHGGKNWGQAIQLSSP